MPKFEKSKVTGPARLVAKQKFDTRIRVGAQRAPQITPQTGVGQSALGDLFDSLGDFSKGEFATKMRAERHEDLKGIAEMAVAQGKTLDEVDTKMGGHLIEGYYRGAIGQKKGVDMLTALQADIDENENNDEYSAHDAGQAILAQINGLDPDQASNAFAIVGPKIQAMVAAEDTRRINKAQNDALYTGMGVTTDLNLIAAKDNDYGQVYQNMADRRRDNKHMPNWTAKAHNQWEANEWISYLKENGPTAEWREAVMQSFDGSEGGPSLWNNKAVGHTLRNAWTSAVADQTVGNAKAIGETRAQAQAYLDENEAMSPEYIAALERFESEAAMATWHKKIEAKRLQVVKETLQVGVSLAAPEEGAKGNQNPYQYVAKLDNTEFESMILREEKLYADRYESDPDMAWRKTIANQSRHGRMTSDTARRINSGLMSPDTKELETAYVAASTFQAQNPMLMDSLSANALANYNRITMVTSNGLGFQDYIEGKTQFDKGFNGAKVMMSAPGSQKAINEAIAGKDLPAGMTSEVRDLVTYGLATGNFSSVEEAASAAVETLSNSVVNIDGMAIRTSMVDSRFGERSFLNNYKGIVMDVLREGRGFKPGDVTILVDDMVVPIGADQLAGYKAWPRVDGSTWVYNPDQVLIAIVKTDAPLKRTQELYFPKAEVNRKRAVANQADALADHQRARQSEEDGLTIP